MIIIPRASSIKITAVLESEPKRTGIGPIMITAPPFTISLSSRSVWG